MNGIINEEMVPDEWGGEGGAWSGGWWRRCRRSYYTAARRYCTDQCCQTPDPWHNYTMTHTHRIPFAGENHTCSLVAGTSGPIS